MNAYQKISEVAHWFEVVVVDFECNLFVPPSLNIEIIVQKGVRHNHFIDVFVSGTEDLRGQ